MKVLLAIALLVACVVFGASDVGDSLNAFRWQLAGALDTLQESSDAFQREYTERRQARRRIEARRKPTELEQH